MHDISIIRLLFSYALLLFPVGIILWLRIPMLASLGLAILRMTIQLALVGLYLQFIFQWDHIAINLAWMLVMVIVADASVLSGSGLRVRSIGPSLFVAMLIGTIIPVLMFTGGVLERSNVLEAQYVIPIAGMILGNCLRADMIGLRTFYGTLRSQRSIYELTLAEGATLREAITPWFRDAVQAALAPTIGTMATIGLVSLPGMMTGVILAGADPFVAIKYQIAIMIAIFSGTALTVFLAISLTLRTAFDDYGNLRKDIFADRS